MAKSERRNYTYFFINLIISLIISFFHLVFNEFIILFFCDLDKDTHLEISKRSSQEEKLIKLESINDDEEWEIRNLVVFKFKYLYIYNSMCDNF